MMRAAMLAIVIALAGCADRDPLQDNRNPHSHGTVDGLLSGNYAISKQASGGESLADLGREGVRVLVEPSFGRYAYYLSLRRLPAGCLPRDRRPSDGSAESRACGASRVYVRRIDQLDNSLSTSQFFLPPDESDAFLQQLDGELRDWRGSNFDVLDGTGMGIERVRDGQVTSMSSNASADNPNNPAVRLSADLLRILLAYGPSGFAPRSRDWHVRHPDDNEDPCNNYAVAVPLDKGFGVGDSDCDAAARWPHLSHLQ